MWAEVADLGWRADGALGRERGTLDTAGEESFWIGVALAVGGGEGEEVHPLKLFMYFVLGNGLRGWLCGWG